MTLGEKIRDCRIRAGLSQEKLAEHMDVTRQAVGKWETGQSAPSAENLQRLSDLFGESMTPPSVPAGPAPASQEPAASPPVSDTEPAALLELLHRERREQGLARKRRLQRSLTSFLLFCAAYLLLYFLGRIVWCLSLIHISEPTRP